MLSKKIITNFLVEPIMKNAKIEIFRWYKKNVTMLEYIYIWTNPIKHTFICKLILLIHPLFLSSEVSLAKWIEANRKYFGRIKFDEIECDCLTAHGAVLSQIHHPSTLGDPSQMHICQKYKNIVNLPAFESFSTSFWIMCICIKIASVWQ